MKMIMTGLPPLVDENQKLLGQLISQTMYFNQFKIDGIVMQFVEDDD